LAFLGVCELRGTLTTFTYDQVTPETIKGLVTQLQAAGSHVTPHDVPNWWTITGHGVTAVASYNPATLGLAVQVTSKPFFVPESFINTGILKALGRA
jgi:hypothetical protein